MPWTPTHNLTNEEYHSHPAISRSALSLVAKSPRHFWEVYRNPNHVKGEPSPAMKLGTAVHSAILEPELFDKAYALAPDVSRATKAGKEAWAAAAENGVELLSAADWATVQGIRSSIATHPMAQQCFGAPGQNESTFIAEDPTSGLELKCRPDRLTDSGWVVDLKTTSDASEAEFARSIAKFGYHLQAAFYLRTLEIASGTRPRGFIFLAVEKTAPYAVQMFQLGPESLARGAQDMEQHLRTLADCVRLDLWPGYSEGVVDIEVPYWALR